MIPSAPKPHHASVGVGVIIERDGMVLLQRRTGAHGEGTWSCPGGHIDFGETLEKCARRETREETGLEVGPVTFAGITNDVFPAEQKHYVTAWVKAEYLGGEPVIQSPREVTDVGWFPWDYLPEPRFVPLKNLVAGRAYPVPAGLQARSQSLTTPRERQKKDLLGVSG